MTDTEQTPEETETETVEHPADEEKNLHDEGMGPDTEEPESDGD